MTSYQIPLCPGNTSTRSLPVNFDSQDLRLFEHELTREIPETLLTRLPDVTVSPAGILFRGSEMLPESFPGRQITGKWARRRARMEFAMMIRNRLLGRPKVIEETVYWVTDVWSQQYFHWMTDALPRLFAIRESLVDATLLLPKKCQNLNFVVSSLKALPIRNVQFLKSVVRCPDLRLPSHTAPTGNYNESVVNGLRSLFTEFYEDVPSSRVGDKVYISRGKARKRKIVNEEACLDVLQEYGFNTVYFEDLTFEQQLRVAMDAEYVISNHGAGLTNVLFMKPGGSILELRKSGDSHSNCYFALASALQLRYFYQLCPAENPDEDAHTANLVVDCGQLRRNIEQMLADKRWAAQAS